ncbi:hypothetical protein JCM33374_g4827 [Metschnikowia sp. JCM 33374]|nr:hypothetical protein JCM33374_g4827 [Metschnikowia sp. JCM 33374]
MYTRWVNLGMPFIIGLRSRDHENASTSEGKPGTSEGKPGIFKGKVVFATGGAGTICRVQTEAIVLLGADVVIIGINFANTEQVVSEIQKLRTGAKVFVIGGIGVPEVQALARVVHTTVTELGRIDFVIAEAAGNFLAGFNNVSSNCIQVCIFHRFVGLVQYHQGIFQRAQKDQSLGSICPGNSTL